jgi:two-component system chemotaxis response regulator CheV
MVSLRGILVPVVDLVKYAGVETEKKPEIMIVTEYNGHTQGFLVEAVDTILRLDWSAMRVPPDMLSAQMGGLVTAVTELADGRLVMMMDVEKVLSETSHFDDDFMFTNIRPLEHHDRTIFYCDDSSVARNQIQRTLDAMNIRGLSANNGRQAWDELQRIATQADAAHVPVTDFIQLVLTDVEMPEMDGYVLTKNIKSDPRFTGIPVIMHSSLSSTANQQLGRSVGVDEYVPKFEPQKLAAILTELLTGKR